MTKKSSMKTIFISSLIVFVIAYIHNLIIENFIFKETFVGIIVGLIIGLAVFAILKITSIFMSFPHSAYKGYKVFMVSGLITYCIASVIMFILFMDKNTVANLIIKSGFVFGYGYAFSAVFVIIFMWCCEDENLYSRRQSVSGLIRRIANKKNPDNLSINLRRFLEPEMYFDDDYGKELYFANEENLQKKAEEAAIEFINENNLAEETSSEWFLSRVDFNCKDSYEEPLTYHMNFIKRTVQKVTINFIPLPDREYETESFKLICSFDYNQNNAEDPFELTSIEEV